MEERATPINRLQQNTAEPAEQSGDLVNDILREMDQADTQPEPMEMPVQHEAQHHTVSFNEQNNQVHEGFDEEEPELTEAEMNAYMEHEQSAVRVFMTKEAVVLFILFVLLQLPQIQIKIQQVLQKLFAKLNSQHVSYIDMAIRAIAMIIAFMLIREFFL